MSVLFYLVGSTETVGRHDQQDDGGGRKYFYTKGENNGYGTDGVGGVRKGAPPTTMGDSPKTPGGPEGPRQGQELGGGNPSTTRRMGPGTPWGDHGIQGLQGGGTYGDGEGGREGFPHKTRVAGPGTPEGGLGTQE